MSFVINGGVIKKKAKFSLDPILGLNPIRYYRADNVVITDGLVSQLNDPNGNHATQSVLSNQPERLVDGNGDFFIRCSRDKGFVGNNLGVSNVLTFICSYKVTEINFGSVLSSDTGESSNRLNIHLPFQSDFNIYFDLGSSAANGGRLNSNWGGAINTKYTWTFQRNGANGFIQRDNTTIASRTNMTSSYTGTGQTSWFLSSAGDLYKAVAFNYALTTEQINLVKANL